MSTKNDAVKIAKNPLLELDITGEIPLVELTEQLNNICEQAEEQTNAIVVFQFLSNSLRLMQWPGSVDIRDVNRWERAVQRLERIPAVIIAVASGVTSGPTLDLLLVTDYRIVTADFQLHVPVNDGHVWIGVAIYRLVNQLGLARARQILMGAHKITAQLALDIGLIDEISDAVPDTVRATVSRLSLMSGSRISICRQLLLEASSTTLEEAFGTYLAVSDRELRRLSVQGDSDSKMEGRQ